MRDAGFTPSYNTIGGPQFYLTEKDAKEFADFQEWISVKENKAKFLASENLQAGVRKSAEDWQRRAQPVDPEGFDFPGDLADIGGDVVRDGLAVAGGLYGGRKGSNIGGLLGPVGRVVGGTIGAVQTAGEFSGLGERARQEIGNRDWVE